MDNYSDLEQRLGAIERDNKRLRFWLRIVIVGAIALVAGGWIAQERLLSIDKIETNDLSINDNKGNPRIRMQVGKDDDLTLFRMFGADTSVSMITMGVSAKRGASSLTFADTKGRRRLTLTIEQDTNVLVNFYNVKGKISTAFVARGMTSALYGGAFVAIDSSGNSRIMAGTTPEENYEPFIYFYDKAGRQRSAINVRENGVGVLKFNDEQGRACTAVGVQPKSKGFVVTLDTTGKSLWGSP